MSSTPSQENDAATANAPFFGNLELFWAGLDVEEEEEEDLERIQCEANEKIVAARICNEKICKEWEDWKQKEEEEQKLKEEEDWRQKEEAEKEAKQKASKDAQKR